MDDARDLPPGITAALEALGRSISAIRFRPSTLAKVARIPAAEVCALHQGASSA